jgi:fructokinase
MLRIGIDVGGTKIEVVALDEKGGELLRRRVPTPADDYEATLAAMAELVFSVERELGAQCSVGIGTPGALSRATGRIKNSNSLTLNGQPLKQDIERLLAREVRTANDANCFALSEAVDGAGAGAPVVFGVILGTGVGGGISVRGRILEGVNAIAGEWGHNPLPGGEEGIPVPVCKCRRLGCVEAYLAGPALERQYREQTGIAYAAPQIVAAGASGEAAAEACLKRYEARLARALAVVINIVDPDVIVLGGGMSNVERLYANVPRLWVPYVFSDRIDTRLEKNRHGDSSGVRGAAWLWGS